MSKKKKSSSKTAAKIKTNIKTMVPKEEERGFRKFVSIVNKLDVFFNLFFIIWALLIEWYSVFVDWKYLKADLSEKIAFIFIPITIAVAIIIKRIYYKAPDNKKRKAAFLIWNAAFPLLYNIVFFFLMDRLYEYSGVFLGGITQYLARIMNMILPGFFLAVYITVKVIQKKRRENGKEMKPEKVKKIKTILNVTLSIIILLTPVIIMTNVLRENYQQSQFEKRVESQQDFIESMENKLSGDADISTVCNEAKLTLVALESMSKGESINVEDADHSSIFKETKVTQSVIDTALPQYLEVTNEYPLKKPFSEGNPIPLYDTNERTVHIGFTTDCTTPEGKESLCSIVCKYDSDWNLVKIYTLNTVFTASNMQ